MTLSFHDITFDPTTGELCGAVSRCRLPPKSVSAVMRALMVANGRIVTRSTLVDAMWGGRDDGPEDKHLDVVIHRLRRDLAAIRAPIFIRNEWGVGFRLTVESRRVDLRIRCPHCGERLARETCTERSAA